MDEKRCCPRCGEELKLEMREFSLGGDGHGGLSSLFVVQYDVDIYLCPQCGKVELYAAAPESESEPEPKVKCSRCGAEHSPEIGCPRCALNDAYHGSSGVLFREKKEKKSKLPWER